MTHKITVNNVEHAYTAAGTGEPIILLHGWTCNRSFWNGQVEFLSRNHQVIAIDFRSHGESHAPPVGNAVQQLSDDIAKVINALGFKTAVVVGHSMGGMVAQQLCVNHPERIKALILVTTIAADPEDRLISKRIDIDTPAIGYRKAFLKHFNGWFDPETDPAIIDWSREQMLKTPEQTALSLTRSYRRFDLRAHLPSIQAPTLVIGAASDASAMPAEANELASLIPEAQLYMIEQCGHFPMLEKSDILNRLIDEFLTTINIQNNRRGVVTGEQTNGRTGKPEEPRGNLMNGNRLHDDILVIDGLNISNWGREVFEDMRRGGLTAVNCTCSIWENFKDTMINISQWKKWFQENSDLIVQVYTVEDIFRAKEIGKTGIILGFQNVTAFEDRLGYIQLFKELGVGIAQMAYNTQNFVGAGCYESKDGGLSDFGREVVAEMNRVGMMCDLSHVGSKTSEDVILTSKKPVCYSHCLPIGLREHPRNKSDAELKFIADHGGFVGVTMYTPFIKRGVDATVDDYIESMDYIINITGEDCIGIGTDFTQGHGRPFVDWITHDKGTARKLTEFGEIKYPEGFGTIGDFPNLPAAMERAGWPETKIRKVMGENWIRVFKEVWDV